VGIARVATCGRLKEVLYAALASYPFGFIFTFLLAGEREHPKVYPWNT